MKGITAAAALLTLLFLTLRRSGAFHQNIRVTSKQQQRQLFLSQSSNPEVDEIFNENDDILSGEPRWFESYSQSGGLVDQVGTESIDKGAIRRTLPLYLLNDDQCFPTGTVHDIWSVYGNVIVLNNCSCLDL